MRKNTEQHAKIAKLRSLGMSLRSIAEECGLSIPRVHQILNPYNSEGAFIEYKCAKCGASWTSKSRTKPKRCPSCGTHYWSKNATVATGVPAAPEHSEEASSVSVVEENLTPSIETQDTETASE